MIMMKRVIMDDQRLAYSSMQLARLNPGFNDEPEKWKGGGTPCLWRRRAAGGKSGTQALRVAAKLFGGSSPGQP